MAGRLRFGKRATVASAAVLIAVSGTVFFHGCDVSEQFVEPSRLAQELLVGPAEGRWHTVRTNRFDPALTPNQRREIEKLESIGYLGHIHEASGLSEVTRYNRDRAWSGINLVTSGHGPEARLIDMDGGILHEWRYTFDQVWPESAEQGKDSSFWRRTHLFENGDLLAIFEGHGIIRLDKDSNLIWVGPVRAHHDIAVAPDGEIHVLSREAHLDPSVNEKTPILEDFVSALDPGTGEERRKFSLLTALERSAFDIDWSRRKEAGGDLFHTNSLEILDGRIAERVPEFRDGNLLVSFLFLNRIAVVDPAKEELVWVHEGDFKAQHDPQVLPSGNLLLFDNRGRGDTSSVQEIDPTSGEIVWAYRGTDAEPFFSLTCGVAQRLPNGNTLITETDFGRAFEVSPDGTIVWEYYNPYRAGEDDKYIATLMEVRRLPTDFPLDWTE